MELFVAIADLGSLTAAAQALDMSRSMATRHIASLEKSLGTRLLHRSTRSLGLTHAGETLLPFCRIIIEQKEQLYHAAQHTQIMSEGKITIVCSISFGQLYLAEALERFMEMYPKIDIDLRLSDGTVDIIKESIDIAIELGNQLPEQLIGKKLADCISVICASPVYLAKQGGPQTLADLENHNCLVHKKLGKRWHFVSKDKKQSHQIDVNSRYSVNDSSILLNATLSGKGLACLPLPFVQEHLQTGALTIVLPDFSVNSIGIWALYASRQYQPKTHRCLLDYLHQDLTQKHQHTR